jgi:hypothetical protein
MAVATVYHAANVVDTYHLVIVRWISFPATQQYVLYVYRFIIHEVIRK